MIFNLRKSGWYSFMQYYQNQSLMMVRLLNHNHYYHHRHQYLHFDYWFVHSHNPLWMHQELENLLSDCDSCFADYYLHFYLNHKMIYQIDLYFFLSLLAGHVAQDLLFASLVLETRMNQMSFIKFAKARRFCKERERQFLFLFMKFMFFLSF